MLAGKYLFRTQPICALVLSSLMISACAFSQTSSSYGAVDPFIGTIGGGNTFPGASLPFGMIQWSPDTTTSGWYRYNVNKIYGFSLTHLSGAGCPLYGDFPFLPLSDAAMTDTLTASPATARDSYAIAFDHKDEEAHPGYYSVTLANGVKVALTVTGRAGIARIVFPQGRPARLLLNSGGSAITNVHSPLYPPVGREQDGSEIAVEGEDEVSGSVTSGGFCGTDSRYTLYFAAKFQKPFQHFGIWNEDTIKKDERHARGKHTGAWVDFAADQPVLMKVGLSYVSTKNALDNINKELPGWDFDHAHADAKQTWVKMLDHVTTEGGTADQRKIFYTGIYHMMLSPTLFSDANGDYIGFDEKIRSLASGRQKAQYANFSDWDIYRNPIQLQALLMPARVSDMMQSLVNDAEQSGWLPNWEAANDVTYVMGGDSPAAVITSAYAFGARNFDTAEAFKYLMKGATQPGMDLHDQEQRPFLADYLKLGYVPLDKLGIAASVSLEYASDDFGIAQFAKATGHLDAYHQMLTQAGDWRNLFDPETKMIRPRLSDGSWLKDFNIDKPSRDGPGRAEKHGFQEGNTWHYTFMIPFDYPRLVQSMGGDDAVIPRLDRFFAKIDCRGEPCYTVGNEPDFVAPFAYLYVGKPWKAQEVLTRVEQEAFNPTPGGIPGNDDLGATSGVYVWNALGLYPGVPGLGGVFLGTPMFKTATLHLDDGRTIVVRGEGTGPYVSSVLLNGKDFANSWLPLSSLGLKTTDLHFNLSPQPNQQRGEPASQRPPSFLQ